MSNQANIRTRGLNTPADFWGLVDLMSNLPAAKELLTDIRAENAALDDQRTALGVELKEIEKARGEHKQRLAELETRETALTKRQDTFVADERKRTAELSQLQTDLQAKINHYGRITAEAVEQQAAFDRRVEETEKALAERTAALDARDAELTTFAEQSESLRRTLSALT